MRPLCIIAVAALLGGCASHTGGTAPRPPNPALAQPSAEFLDFVAKDAAGQVAGQFQPARQPLILMRPFTSPLQQRVLASLRQQGFAVQEVSSVSDARARLAAGSAPGEHSRGLFAVDPLLLDVRAGAAATDLYYVRVDIGNTVLSRPYVITPQAATPAGAWVRKESNP